MRGLLLCSSLKESAKRFSTVEIFFDRGILEELRPPLFDRFPHAEFLPVFLSEIDLLALLIPKGLQEFVSFLERKRCLHITVNLALEWATQHTHQTSCEWAARLSIVRSFARQHR